MKKLSNIEANLKKNVAYKKRVYPVFEISLVSGKCKDNNTRSSKYLRY